MAIKHSLIHSNNLHIVRVYTRVAAISIIVFLRRTIPLQKYNAFSLTNKYLAPVTGLKTANLQGKPSSVLLILQFLPRTKYLKRRCSPLRQVEFPLIKNMVSWQNHSCLSIKIAARRKRELPRKMRSSLPLTNFKVKS